MRVLCVTNMYPTATDPAYGSFVKEQVEDLRTLGLHVDVVSFDARRRRASYATAARVVRTRVHDEQYDVVHAHYGLSGAVALAQQKCPVVTTFHGSDTGYVRWQGKVSWLVARRTVPVFVSRAGAEALGLPQALVVPMGVDTELFSLRNKRAVRHELGLDEEGTYILFPGARRNARKRYPLFQATLSALSDDGRPVHELVLEGATRPEVAALMSAADAILMTSEFEGSPVAVKEALAAGTPVVSTAVGDLDDLVGGLPGCSVLNSDDPTRLAAAVAAALEGADRDRLRARALTYSRETVARRIRDIFVAEAGV